MYKKLLFREFAAEVLGFRIFRELAGFRERIEHFSQSRLAGSATSPGAGRSGVEDSTQSGCAFGDCRFDAFLGDAIAKADEAFGFIFFVRRCHEPDPSVEGAFERPVL